MSTVPALRDLVLVGGGHAHVEVLRRFGMRPQPGVRLTLISRETLTPYSGMLPGLIAGQYAHDDIHIDLVPLAAFAGARFIADELVALNLQTNRIELAAHPALRFDLLSLNTGAIPATTGAFGTRVKPIGRFLPELEQIRTAAAAGDTLAVVGGGAGGVELILALRQLLPRAVRLVLVTDRLLPGLPGRVVRRLSGILSSRGIEVLQGFRVIATSAARLEAEDGRSLEFDHLLWVAGVAAPGWARSAGLATDDAGFVRVDATLNSLSHSQVFAAGDIACLEGQERSKAGVYAVRQGGVLAANLRRRLLGSSLRRYHAQPAHLVIAGTGDGRAVAARGALSLYGRWVWRWKRWIDRRFVQRFSRLPEPMAPGGGVLPRILQPEAPEPMRCTGCGSKLGAGLLDRVLARLPRQGESNLLLGVGDDAAVVRVTEPELILSVDGFPSMLSDPYRFGRILAHHCLNDLIAMGGRGRYALACASVPLMSEAMMEEDLHALLLGALEVLNRHGVFLVGGHSHEGADLTLTLTLTGDMDGQAILTRAGLRDG
ncbi:MAG: FAD-dependent oxidoreductase, partial [Pseudomonadales bacterium]|nr:FAD-dependent oxidoreductase [Pseudomonadales bacterium]